MIITQVTTRSTAYCKWLDETGMEDIDVIGGKSAQLAQRRRRGNVSTPNGFAVTTRYHEELYEYNPDLLPQLRATLDGIDLNDNADLARRSQECRRLIVSAKDPIIACEEVRSFYAQLGSGEEMVAVRSSGTNEDGAKNAMAGNFDSFMFRSGGDDVVLHLKKCVASVFSERSITYHLENGIDIFKPTLAILVLIMVNSRRAGQIFTKDVTNGDPDRIQITIGWGQGQPIVGGQLNVDNYTVHRQTREIIERRTSRQTRMQKLDPLSSTEDEERLVWVDVPDDEQMATKASDDDLQRLVDIALAVVEEAGGMAQDIEFAEDPETGEFKVVQNRPITFHSFEYLISMPLFTTDIEPTVDGGTKGCPGTVTGRVWLMTPKRRTESIPEGFILVAHETDPDDLPNIRRARGIIAASGDRTCHAAITAREFGKPAIVGMEGVMDVLQDGQLITLDANHCMIFEGEYQPSLSWEELRKQKLAELDEIAVDMKTHTKVMAICAYPEELPNLNAKKADGIGLLREEEFLVQLGRHPQWFIDNGKEEEYIQALAKFLGSFCEQMPQVVFRTMDFKANELAGLDRRITPAMMRASKLLRQTGNLTARLAKAVDQKSQLLKRVENATNRHAQKLIKQYEDLANERNPMLGFRGTFRYKMRPEQFAMEVEALRRVAENHDNLVVMLPFVRTMDELEWAIDFMAERGLKRRPGLQIWMMAELPSNLAMLKVHGPRIRELLDGVSIGSNDLTQMVLGKDRDNAKLAEVGDERDPLVQWYIREIVVAARALSLSVSLCGQSASDFPEITELLVKHGATSVSVSPDMIGHTRLTVRAVEETLGLHNN